MIITSEAAEWIRKRGNKIWLNIRLGGCTGFTYEWSREQPADTSVLACEAHGIELYTDPTSYEILIGATIELTQNLLGVGLKVINTDANKCRCNKSFITQKANEMKDLLNPSIKNGCFVPRKK